MHRAEIQAEVKSLRMELDALAEQGHTPSNNRAARDISYRLSQRSELQEQMVGMEASELALIRPAVLMGERSGLALLLAKAKEEERMHLAQAKACARKGETGSARLFAQEVVRVRKALSRLYAMDGTETVRGVEMLIEDVDERVSRAAGFGAAEVGSNRVLYKYSAELASDGLRLDWCEAELRRQAKALVEAGQTDAARMLSKGIVDVIAAQKRLRDAVDGIAERVGSESVKAGIRCIHI